MACPGAVPDIITRKLVYREGGETVAKGKSMRKETKKPKKKKK